MTINLRDPVTQIAMKRLGFTEENIIPLTKLQLTQQCAKDIDMARLNQTINSNIELLNSEIERINRRGPLKAELDVNKCVTTKVVQDCGQKYVRPALIHPDNRIQIALRNLDQQAEAIDSTYTQLYKKEDERVKARQAAQAAKTKELAKYNEEVMRRAKQTLEEQAKARETHGQYLQKKHRSQLDQLRLVQSNRVDDVMTRSMEITWKQQRCNSARCSKNEMTSTNFLNFSRYVDNERTLQLDRKDQFLESQANYSSQQIQHEKETAQKGRQIAAAEQEQKRLQLEEKMRKAAELHEAHLRSEREKFENRRAANTQHINNVKMQKDIRETNFNEYRQLDVHTEELKNTVGAANRGHQLNKQGEIWKARNENDDLRSQIMSQRFKQRGDYLQDVSDAHVQGAFLLK